MNSKSVTRVVLLTLIGAAVGYGLPCYLDWQVHTLAESLAARTFALGGAVVGCCLGWCSLLPIPKGQ